MPVGAQDAIKVGSKDFPESIIIGEIYAQLLENAGFSVERKLNLGGTVIAQEALLSGDLDLYPEYTGTGLLVVLGESLAECSRSGRHAHCRHVRRLPHRGRPFHGRV